MTKSRNFVAICLVALFVVYCGISVIAAVYTTVNMNESMLLDSRLFSRKPATKPRLMPLGDPIADPRPHELR